MKYTLKEEDFVWAANQLGCEVAAIKAVDYVESRGKGFYPTGEPTILFERHVFRKETQAKYDKEYPELSNVKRGGYGSESIQLRKLEQASRIDATYFNNGTIKKQPNRDAALKSCSWGRFQIMGFNYKLAGFSKLQDFINAMYRSERDQLMAFVNFIKSTGSAKHLINKRFDLFAAIYNGPGYKKYSYDVKMAAAYRKFSNGQL